MTWVLVAGLLGTAHLLGAGVGEPLGVPGAYVLLPVVVAAALARGAVPGAAAGFGAGLLLDLAPGSTAPIGSGALAGTVAGGLTGLLAVAFAGVGSERATGPGDRHDALAGRARGRAGGGPGHVPHRSLLAAGATVGALLVQGVVHAGLAVLLGVAYDPPAPTPAAVAVLLGAVLVPGLARLLGPRGRRG